MFLDDWELSYKVFILKYILTKQILEYIDVSNVHH